jgi:myo-inositol-1(or 4)-monophosphatase
MADATPTDLLSLAREIAVDAGALIVRRRAEGVTVAASKSSPEDVVTFADREAEDFIRARLAEARPGDGFFGEESAATPSTTGITWVVDPIDGTVNYLYGIPAYAVSIAAVAGDPDPATWTALAGCVVNPELGEVFTASAGGGAFLGEQPLSVNTDVALTQALVGTGFAYSAELRVKQGVFITGLLGRVRDIRRAGSAALDLCSVAAGRLDAYVERGLNPWDHAAGALIAREAGAFVGGFEESAESAVLTFAADPALAAELKPLVDRLHRDAGLPR